MLELGHIRRVVAVLAVGIDNAVGSDFLVHNRHQGCRCRIGDDLRVNLAAPLQKTEDSNFSLDAASALSSCVQDSCKDAYDDDCLKTAS